MRRPKPRPPVFPTDCLAAEYLVFGHEPETSKMGKKAPIVGASEASLTVTVLLFAAHRDAVGTSEISVDLPEGSAVSALIALLVERGGVWTSFATHSAVAVNQAYATLGSPLSDGDEVALIPPVSGG